MTRDARKSRQGKVINYSPSTGDLFEMCARRGWYLKGQGVFDPPTPALETGTTVHEALDMYLQNGTWPVEGTEFDNRGETLTIEARHLQIAQAGEHHLSPLLGTIRPELWTRAPMVPGMGMVGKIDMSDMSGDVARSLFPAAELPSHDVPYIGDHKTTSSFNYTKSAQALRWNAQMLLYAGAAVLDVDGKFGSVFSPSNHPEVVAVQHIYYRTKGAPLSTETHVLVPWDNVEKVWEEAKTRANRIYDVLGEEDPENVPFNASACRKYNRLCPAAALCSQSPQNRQSQRLSVTSQEPKMSLDSLLSGTPRRKRGVKTPPSSTPVPTFTRSPITPPDEAATATGTNALVHEVADACIAAMRMFNLDSLDHPTAGDACRSAGLPPTEANLVRVAQAGQFVIEGVPMTLDALMQSRGFSTTDIALMTEASTDLVLDNDLHRDAVTIDAKGVVTVRDDAPPVETAPVTIDTQTPSVEGHVLETTDDAVLDDQHPAYHLTGLQGTPGLRPGVVTSIMAVTPLMSAMQIAGLYKMALVHHPEPVDLKIAMIEARTLSNEVHDSEGWQKIGRYTLARVKRLLSSFGSDILVADYEARTLGLADGIYLSVDEPAAPDAGDLFGTSPRVVLHRRLTLDDFTGSTDAAREAMQRATQDDEGTLRDAVKWALAHQRADMVVALGLRLRALGVQAIGDDPSAKDVEDALFGDMPTLQPLQVEAPKAAPKPKAKVKAKASAIPTEPTATLTQTMDLVQRSIPTPVVSLAGFPVYVGCYPQAGSIPRDLDAVLVDVEKAAILVERNQDGAKVRHWGQFDFGRGQHIMAMYLRDALERDGWQTVLGTEGVYIDQHHPLRGAVLPLLRVIPEAIVII